MPLWLRTIDLGQPELLCLDDLRHSWLWIGFHQRYFEMGRRPPYIVG
jgi:hypothetical protein